MSIDREMQIAVVDDLPADCAQIMENTEEILNRAHIPHRMDGYCGGYALLEAIKGGKKYNLFIVDVVMDGMDGMTLAAALRQAGNGAAIILISDSHEMARHGYRVEAARYLLKPLEREELEEALRYCYNKWHAKKEILLQTPKGQHRISFSDIQFVEAFDRGTRFVLNGEAVESRMKFNEVQAILPKSSFILCHRAYIVNLAMTKRISPYEFTMKSGAVVPISRLRYNEINQKFMSFLLD